MALHETRLNERVRSFLGRPQKLLIGGAWVEAESGLVFEALDPATEEVTCLVAEAGIADVDRAVRAARRAFEGPWSTTTPSQRTRLISRISDRILERIDDFAQLEALDTGKSVRLTRSVDCICAAEVFQHYAGSASRVAGVALTSTGKDASASRMHSYTVRRPLGVCGAALSNSFPLLSAALRIAPALANGNAVVLHPSQSTSLTALLLGEVVTECDLAPGVVNIVTGPNAVATAIATHHDVDRVIYPGPPEPDDRLALQASGNFGKVSWDVGGTNPNIVFEDADFDEAIAGTANSWLFNRGNSPMAGSVLLIQTSIFDDFLAALADFAGGARIGHGLDPATELGPLASYDSLSQALDLTADAITRGARAVIGGERHGAVGYFMQPTILVGAGDDCRILHEGAPGPVVVAIPFADEHNALDLVNNTGKLAAAGIWTSDMSRAHRFANDIRAETVWVNTYNIFSTSIPGSFGSSDSASNYGDGDLGLYTRSQAVNVQLTPA
jgi:aldehyde dehydrogenase (NAD+)